MSASGSANKGKLTSRAWKYFNIKDNNLSLAKCKLCQKVLSYRTSTSNLLKHIKYRHKNDSRANSSDKSEIEEDSPHSLSVSEDDDFIDVDDSEDNQADKALESIETKNEEESVCLLCDETFPDQDSAEMMEHMFKVHNISQIKLVDGSLHLEQEESKPEKIRPGRSCSWDYFTDKDNIAKVAVCNLCNGDFSYKSTVSNLVKHLKRKHNIVAKREHSRVSSDNSDKKSYKPRSLIWTFFKYVNEEKSICACVHCNKEFNVIGGMKLMKIHLINEHPEALMHHKTTSDPLFITANETDNEGNDDDLQAEYLDLDDLNDSDKVKNKPNFDISPSFERRSSFEHRPKKRRFCPSPIRTQNKFGLKAQNKIPDSLEYFSNYITCLLQELPEKISKKLQMSFVKQIIEAQLSCAEKEDSKEAGTRINSTVGGTGAKIDASIDDSDTVEGITTLANNCSNMEIPVGNGLIIRAIDTTP